MGIDKIFKLDTQIHEANLRDWGYGWVDAYIMGKDQILAELNMIRDNGHIEYNWEIFDEILEEMEDEHRSYELENGKTIDMRTRVPIETMQSERPRKRSIQVFNGLRSTEEEISEMSGLFNVYND